MTQGSARRNTALTPMSFGTNASVCSWICVTACTTLIVRPTRSATTSIGPAMSRASITALRARSTMRACDMAVLAEARNEALHDQRPAVHEHEQQQLEGQGDHRRREHEHTHAHEHRAHRDVDDDERQEQRGA